MASCAYCGTFILFGGKKDAELRFCNVKCQQSGALRRVADELPPEEVEKFIEAVHLGPCPLCQGPGPVDVHTSYRIWSAVFMTSWSSRPSISCRSCGFKSMVGSTAYSALLGWWGIPWGLLGTPVQIVRNLGAMAMAPDTSRPSAKLEKFLRLELAARIAREN